MTHASHQTKRLIGAGLAAVFVLGLAGAGLFISFQDARAQDNAPQAAAEVLAGAAESACPTSGPVPATCPPRGIRLALKTVGEKIASPTFRIAVIQALMNLSRFVLDRLAYEAAVAIASGGPGEESLFYNKTPADAFGQLGLEAAGEAVYLLSSLSSEALGVQFNLCAPEDPLISLALAIGIKQRYQPTAPRCDILKVGKAWGSFFTNAYQTIADPEARQQKILSTFAESLRPGKNELSATLRVHIAVDGKIREQKLLELMGITKSDYKPVTDFITGDVKTPGSTLQKDFQDKLAKAENKDDVKVGDLVSAGDLIGGLALTTASTFTNTLLSTLFSRIYTGLFDTAFETDPFDLESTAGGGKAAAQERFASIITTNPIAAQEYNALSDFVVCPAQGVTNRGLYNCVMDVNFLAAVSRGTSGSAAAMTVQEAIDEGLLDGDFPFINPEDAASNQDPFCYTYGYCYGNLVKLRKARVIPIGWEMAAQRSDVSNPATLQEVIDGFDDCTQEGTVGPANASNDTSRWCHLIDPNWVLKYPDTQCRAAASGEIRISNLTAGRASYCVDAPSCIGEDNDGECTDGYGYCVQEENVWRFRGDECPEQYATCLSFQNTDSGGTGDYLVSTVDYSVCNADNAGCQWVRTQKRYEDAGTSDDDSDDSYEWLPGGETYTTASREADWKYQDATGATQAPADYSYTSESGVAYSYSTYAYEDRFYLTNNVEECSEADAGCSRLYAFEDDLALNHVQNPSFEDDEDDDDFPDAWLNASASASAQTIKENDALYGSASFLTDVSVIEQYIPLSANEFYTLSFSARADDTSATDTEVSLSLFDVYGEDVSVAGTSYGGNCAQSTSSYTLTLDPGSSFTEGEWTRFDCTFTTPADTAQALLSIDSDALLLDAVQLELGEDATDFTNGYSATPAQVFYQVAPAYLGCSGSATDPEACGDYAQTCSAQDVGCNLYAPEDGDPNIPAIISELDECPDECVGYTTYKQEATEYESEEFPLYFIADRASACSSQYVGCDSYTNLDSVEEGGEEVESYSSLRFCLSEDIADASSARKTPATFFTWEGSDNEGYQLQTWVLLESNTTASSGSFTTSGGSESSPGLAPCTHVTMLAEDEVACNDSNFLMNRDVWSNDACDEHDDIFENPDCREFFDNAGNIHYREYSDTISISDACAPYRKDDSTETDCEDSGGFWTDQGFCRYYALSSESTECPAAQSGCREYTGGAGRNATTVLSETFEDGTYEDFVMFESGRASATLSVSNESVATDGHSLYLTAAGGLAGFETIQIYLDSTSMTETYDEDTSTTCTDNGGTVGDTGCEVENDVDGDGSADEACSIENGEESCGTLTGSVVAGKTFVLTFWAKGSGDVYVTMNEEGGAGDSHDLSSPETTITSFSDLTPVELTGAWQLYSLGPLDTSGYDEFDENAVLRFAVEAGAEAYVDNIILKQVEENITLIKDSWVVPSTCDATPDGVESDQYYLGCEAYSDQNGNDVDLYQFTSICSEEVVGCEGFYHTANSDSEYTQVYNARCVYSSDTDLTDLELAGSNTDCEIDETTYCTISAGTGYCTFDAEEALPEPLPFEGSGTSYFGIVFGPETVIVPADAPVYLVADESYACGEATMGCQEVGEPTYNQDQSQVESFESVYYLNLPEDYGTLLCDNEALFCEEWTSTQDGNFYFKDPLDKTCEFKESVTIDNQQYQGWFRSGTIEPCDWTDTDEDGAFDPDEDDSYLIAGAEFGVWTNGDDAYDNWVGACSDAYDLCTEFIDVADTGGGLNANGASYYFTDDDLMSEDTLTDNQRCNGQVSQKFGCALFNNTTDSELSYNASASYVVSTHADVFFGEPQNSLQDPINCEADEGGEFTISEADADRLGVSESVNLCSRRCVYELDRGDAIETGSEQAIASSVGNDYFERSCLVDDDCPVLTSTLGETVTGECSTVASRLVTLGVTRGTYTLGNDSNEVLKVNRDRSCSAWLACQSDHPSWNTTTNTYDTICDTVSLCTEGSNQGDQAKCTDWEQSSAEIFTDFVYSSRDVNWSGPEYSGYAIPNQLPVDLYEQENLNPSQWCLGDDGTPALNDNGQPVSCSRTADCPTVEIECASDSECEAEGLTDCDTSTGQCFGACEDAPSDYRLVYNAGPCDADEDSGVGQGGDCSIGYCETSGEACASEDDCSGGEECIVGVCQAEGTSDCVNADCSCATDEDCASTTTSSGLATSTCDPQSFTCVDVLPTDSDAEYCGSTSDCSSASLGQTCVNLSTTAYGSCYNDRCLTDVRDNDGDGFADRASPDEVREQDCRAFPEVTSPFSYKVVEDWSTYVDSDGNGTPDTSMSITTSPTPGEVEVEGWARPYNYVNGYQDSTVCAPVDGEVNDDCLCSYQKVTYGEGSTYRYYSKDVDEADILDGVCAGGDTPGYPCDADGDCPEGSCETVSRSDTLYGWDGYCLEKDSSIQLNGSSQAEDQACLTWLPVDQLSGATDLYGKYTEAGYPLEDSYYCSEVGYYLDLYPTGAVFNSDGEVEDIDYACAASMGDSDPDMWEPIEYDPCVYGEYSSCWYNAYCPDGYMAIVGYCNADPGTAQSYGDTDGSVCQYGGVWTYDDKMPVVGNDGWDDCPYFCVPLGSYHTEGPDAGQECVNSDASGGEIIEETGTVADWYDRRIDDLGESDCLGGRCGTNTDENGNGKSAGTSRYGTPVVLGGDLWGDGSGTFDDVETFKDCAVRGVPFDEGEDCEDSWDSDVRCGLDWSTLDASYFDEATTSSSYNNDTGFSGFSTEGYGFKIAEMRDDFSLIGFEGQSGPDVAYGISQRFFGTKVSVCDLNGVRCTQDSDCPTAFLGFGGGDCVEVEISDIYNGDSASMVPYLGCYEIVQATTDDREDGNKAWTNRLWEGYDSVYATENPDGQDFDDSGIEFGYSVATTPENAGRSLFEEYYEPVDGDEDDADFWVVQYWDADSWPIPLEACDGNPDEDGYTGLEIHPTPDICSGGVYDYPSSFQFTKDDESGETFLIEGDTAASLGKAWEDTDQDPDDENASEFSVEYDDYDTFGNSTDVDNNSITYHLSQLFAKAYDTWRYVWDEEDDDIGHGAYEKVGDANFDISSGTDEGSGVELSDLPNGSGANETSDEGNHAPTIVSVGKCIGTECYEDEEDAFSVENQSSGNITGIGSKQVDVSFFVYAQPNQLPLRNIIVDWGDDFSGISSASDALPWPTGSQSGSVADDNYYKNYRGLNAGGDAICDEGDEWGKTNATCTNSYVSFSHAYICTEGLVEKYSDRSCEYRDDNGRLKNSPCIEDGACVFQPRVYAIDNWEWCTGFCDVGEDEECWGKGEDEEIECNITDCPSEGRNGKCADFNGNDDSRNNNPWVNYDGYIIIEPD